MISFFFNSVLYESVTSLSSLLAITPINLRKQELLSNNTLQNEEMLSLLLSALHVIPSLPYYLAADLWRFQALKEIDLVTGEATSESSPSPLSSSTASDFSYDVEKRDISEEDEEEKEKDEEDEGHEEETAKAENQEEKDDEHEQPQENNEKDEKSEEATVSETIAATQTSSVASLKTEATTTKKIYNFEMLKSDWWRFRGKYQGVGSPDGKNYADFLQDRHVMWNKPYIR